MALFEKLIIYCAFLFKIYNILLIKLQFKLKEKRKCEASIEQQVTPTLYGILLIIKTPKLCPRSLIWIKKETVYESYTPF